MDGINGATFHDLGPRDGPRLALQQAQSLKGLAARCALPAQVQMLEKWRQFLPLRLAMQEQLFREPGQRKVLNQFNGPTAKEKVSQVVKLVDVALQKSKQTKAAGHSVSGLFPIWRANQLAHARLANPGQWSVNKVVDFSKELIEKWGSMPPGQKTAAAIRKLTARAPAPPPPASFVLFC